MESEKNLNSPNFGNAQSTAFATAAMVQSAKGGPKWLRWLVLAFTLIIVVVTFTGTTDKLFSIGKIPKCDAQTTRDTLSDLNKQNNVNASAYNFIKQGSGHRRRGDLYGQSGASERRNAGI